jgi:sugar phosphate permease
MDAGLDGSLERATLRKVYLRVVPCCFLLYILCYIDRVNVSFAALTMNRDIGLSAHIYGLTVGAFFWSYCLLAIPSNMMLQKFGARRWLGSIMIAWGLMAAAGALVSGPVSFFSVRVLLGAAESGLFPGLLVYVYHWFPQHHRSKAIGWFMISMTLANAIGAPVSTAFLQLDGVAGLHGWQWIFLGEGLPTVLIGVVVLIFLTEWPRDARWLKPEERAWLEAVLARESHEIEAAHAHSIFSAMGNPRVLVLALLYGSIIMAGVGLEMFLPQCLRSAGASINQAGLLTGIPYIFGTAAMVMCGYISDRRKGSDHTKDRFGVLIVVCGCATFGLVMAAVLYQLPHAGLFWVLVAFSLATYGIYGFRPPFLPQPSTFLTGPALVGAVALINSLGNIGGYMGPIAVGYARDMTGNFVAGIYVLAGAALVGTLTALGCWLWWVPRTEGQAALRPAGH